MSSKRQVQREAEVLDMVERTTEYMAGAAVVVGIQLGHRLGIYGFMAPRGELRASQVADGIGCNGRLVQEWLDGQVAAGLIELNHWTGTYCLTGAAAMVLADPTSPVFLANGMPALAAMTLDLDKIETAYRTDGALPWGEHHPSLFESADQLFRPGHRVQLVADWIPALNGAETKLQNGAQVLEVGCGPGSSIIAMAQAFAESTFVGIDTHAPSIEAAEKRAAEAGLADRCRFEVADAQSYDGTYDLIAFFDCLNALGDPVGAARHARTRLGLGGSVLLVEPFAIDGRADNISGNPLATMLYHASAMISLPNSLSEDVGFGLGAQAGQDRLREVFIEAGYRQLIRRAETPFSLVLQAHA